MTKYMRLITLLPLNDICKENEIKRATEYMKPDFSTILYINACHVRWKNVWVAIGDNNPQKLKQGRVGVE